MDRLFQEEFGEPCWSFINRKKMEMARELLRDKELSIKAIALQLGYKKSGYFSQVFRQHWDMTPGKMRIQQRQQLPERPGYFK